MSGGELSLDMFTRETRQYARSGSEDEHSPRWLCAASTDTLRTGVGAIRRWRTSTKGGRHGHSRGRVGGTSGEGVPRSAAAVCPVMVNVLCQVAAAGLVTHCRDRVPHRSWLVDGAHRILLASNLHLPRSSRSPTTAPRCTARRASHHAARPQRISISRTGGSARRRSRQRRSRS
jgi:hypothetical protein